MDYMKKMQGKSASKFVPFDFQETFEKVMVEVSKKTGPTYDDAGTKTFVHEHFLKR
jgi:hypothetical protein